MDDVDLLRTEIESVKQFKTALQGYDKKQVTETVTQLTIENNDLKQQLEKVRAENRNLKKQLRDLQLEQAEWEEREAPVPVISEDDIEVVRKEVENSYKAKLEDMAAQLYEAKMKLEDAEAKTQRALMEAQAAQAELEARAAQAEEEPEFYDDDQEYEEDPEILRGSRFEEPPAAKPTSDLSSRVMVEELKAQLARLNEEKRKKSLRIAELEELLQQERDEVEGKISMVNAVNGNMIAMLQDKILELSEFTDDWKSSLSTSVI